MEDIYKKITHFCHNFGIVCNICLFFAKFNKCCFPYNTKNMVVTFGEGSAKILPNFAGIDRVINITNKSQDTAKNLAFDKYKNKKTTFCK